MLTDVDQAEMISAQSDELLLLPHDGQDDHSSTVPAEESSRPL